MSKTQPTCRQIAATVQTHQRTAQSVVEEALQRAAGLQEGFHAFITVAGEAARKQAERVDSWIGQGRRLPLAGVPFAVKDLFDVRGLATTAGSRALKDNIARRDATVVGKLIGAGAVLLGKLNMHECAFGFTGENPEYGDCRNPWDATRIAGGSSSGSAVAVAGGICPLTLGSDAGGSIRFPAALCNLVGLKPTYGRVSRNGVIPLSFSMDHVGPMARTVEDCALALQVLAGSDPHDETSSRRSVPSYLEQISKPLSGLRMGVPGNWFFDALQADVAQAVSQAIQRLAEQGCRRVDLNLPLLEEALGAHRAIIFSEASSYYEPLLRARGEQFGDDIRPLLQAGLFLPATDYLKAQRARRMIRRSWSETLAQVDFLACPTCPIVATRFGQQTADLPGGPKPLLRACLDFTLPFNLTGHPALSTPCGFSSDGLPIGLQLIGKPFAESLILQVAHQYQQHTSWHQRFAS